MIPEIEIHVNIQYAVRGETRPILFSNERQSFTFAIVGSSQYFLFDGPHNGLYRIRDVRSDRQLAALLADGDDALIARLEAVEESEEGEDVINRILSRDETVIALLAEKYLDYTPVETTPFMERDHYEFKVTPEMRAESFASASNDVAGRGMALRLERTPEEIEEALLDEEIEAMRKQLKELEDMTKNLTGGAKMNDADVQKMKESLSRMAQDAPKKMHKRRPEDDYVEQNFYVEHKKHDWSPETLEDKKDKYRKLARRADELIKEIRAFPPRDNVGDVTAMLENFTGLRNNMFDYELQSAIEIGEYVVDSLTLYLAAYKVNPESAAKLIST
ncbi:hypothetical protein H0H87_005438 [Tephrocybe sp. NHM501043]|nr:hypothetical protein H0H87_005438 [Tephrocybe sp. NHM501043]